MEKLLEKAFLGARDIIKKDQSYSHGFNGNEIKLSTDLLLDQYFRNYFELHTNIPVYSEESLGNSSPLKGKNWIIDPLDGSLNYFRRIPFYTSSIALWEDGSPILGGIYDYSRNEFYFGEVNKGASVNGSPIKISTTAKSQGIKATGIPSNSSTTESLRVFEESLNSYKKLRWFGCASLSLAYVACGKVDAYEEKGIKIWDVAAGIALVLAASGRIVYNFNADDSLNLLADNNF